MSMYRATPYVDADRPARELAAVEEWGRWRLATMSKLLAAGFATILCGMALLYALIPSFPSLRLAVLVAAVPGALVSQVVQRRLSRSTLEAIAAKHDVDVESIRVPNVMRSE